MAKPFLCVSQLHCWRLCWLQGGQVGVLTEIVGTEAVQDLPGGAGLFQLAVLATGSRHCCNRKLVRTPVAGKGIIWF